MMSLIISEASRSPAVAGTMALEAGVARTQVPLPASSPRGGAGSSGCGCGATGSSSEQTTFTPERPRLRHSFRMTRARGQIRVSSRSATRSRVGSSLFPVPIAEITGTPACFAASISVSFAVTLSTASATQSKAEKSISSRVSGRKKSRYASTRQTGLMLRTRSLAASVLYCPSVCSVAIIWRFRFERETRSWSTRVRAPTPERASASTT